MTPIIAIDPGAVGGLAMREEDGRVTACAMPDTEAGVVDAIRAMLPATGLVAYVEEVGGFAGGPGQPGSAMFNFGFGCGVIRGALIAMQIRTVMVRPQKWQKALSCGKVDRWPVESGMTAEQRKAVELHNRRAKQEWKNQLKAQAELLFPGVKVTLSTADALLILEYGCKCENGMV
jgi:hypothetical protein